MKRKGSQIASYYERKKRANCKDKPCEKCRYEEICEDKEGV